MVHHLTAMGRHLPYGTTGQELNQRPFDHESNAEPLHHQDNQPSLS